MERGRFRNEALLRERTILRGELKDLKSCQIRYFTASVTGTGVILAVGSRFPEAGNGAAVLFLAPLTIILPCWWIFYDKSTTITRIVGYLRLLESAIAETDGGAFQYVGWENALGRFRRDVRGKPSERLREPIVSRALATLRIIRSLVPGEESSQRYWIICWWTFFGLTSVSTILAVLNFSMASFVPLAISALAAARSIEFTAALLRELISGQYSYDQNEEAWRSIQWRDSLGS